MGGFGLIAEHIEGGGRYDGGWDGGFGFIAEHRGRRYRPGEYLWLTG